MYLDFFPVIVIHLQRAEIVLNWDDVAVTGNKFFCCCAAKVCAFAESNNGCERITVVLPAVGAGVKRLLCALVIYRQPRNAYFSPLMAKARFIASVFMRLRASFSAFSSM